MKVNKKIQIIICSLLAVTVTWFINHEMGYGPIIANGLVGVVGATFLPKDLAGVAYTSSFVGMSSLGIIPNIQIAILGSFIVSLVLLSTAEIYSGMGGKGGTTAALSTIILRAITNLFS